MSLKSGFIGNQNQFFLSWAYNCFCRGAWPCKLLTAWWDWPCAEHSRSCSLVCHERLRSFPPKFVGEVVWIRLTPLQGVRGYCKKLGWPEEEADLLPWASALGWELPCGLPYGCVLLGGRYLRRMALLCCMGSFGGCHFELAQAALCVALKSGLQVWESEMKLCQQNGVNCAFLKLGFI